MSSFRLSREYAELGMEERRAIERCSVLQIPAMFGTLASVGFVQQSIKWDNIMVQPGPLSAAVAKRSYMNPSFRIVDFGRACARSTDEFNKFYLRSLAMPRSMGMMNRTSFDEEWRKNKRWAWSLIDGKLKCLECGCDCDCVPKPSWDLCKRM